MRTLIVILLALLALVGFFAALLAAIPTPALAIGISASSLLALRRWGRMRDAAR